MCPGQVVTRGSALLPPFGQHLAERVFKVSGPQGHRRGVTPPGSGQPGTSPGPLQRLRGTGDNTRRLSGLPSAEGSGGGGGGGGSRRMR